MNAFESQKRILAIASLVIATVAILYATGPRVLPTFGDQPTMTSVVKLFLAVAALVGVAMFAWLWGGKRSATAAPTTSAPAQQIAVASMDCGKPVSRLQVRGVGITVNDLTGVEILQGFAAKAQTHASILSTNASDYPSTWTNRTALSSMRNGLAFKLGAGPAVDYTPLPVLVYAPPKHPENEIGAAFTIAGARQQGSLPFHLFMTQHAVNGPGPSLEEVFKFFDANPDAPAAIVFVSDGMVTRKLLEKPGSGLIADSPAVPAVFDSNVALLVTCPDRVDRLRPFAVTEPASVDTREVQYDAVKLWNFYWDDTDAFDKHYGTEAAARGMSEFITPGTMTVDWWRSRVPDLWKQTQNKGPGEYHPNVWAPVRWTAWQFKEYDQSPVVGYLQRPVQVHLTDDHGEPLRESLQAAAFKDGWQHLIRATGSATQPSRVFFDTTGNRQSVIPLTQALGTEPDAPSTGDVKEGYDIGYRLGNTGITSGVVQIALSLMAGYKDGKASAAVIRDARGNAEMVLVTPPDDVDKSRNAAADQKPFN
ncbi:DUF2875 family protein [Paraburkholderia jirisanensis]